MWRAVRSSTHVYKRSSGGAELRLDVHALDEAGAAKPLLVWLHEGAFMFGGRATIVRQLHQRLLAGHVVASIDYRLAPESRLDAIVDDALDAVRWLRAAAHTVGADTDRLALAGCSAGGYLALLLGARLPLGQRPRALLSWCGYGDLTAAWTRQPDPHFRPTGDEQTAAQAVHQRVELCEALGAERAARTQFYVHCRRRGTWLQQVCGHDAANDEDWLRQRSPCHLVDAQYPPTVMVHGTDDTDVPFAAAAALANSLEHAHVEHQLIALPGAGHFMAGARSYQLNDAYTQAVSFLEKHTQHEFN